MIISRLDLKAFGHFTDVSLDLSAGPRRLHLVFGPNESGKSTSLRAITSLLFGMPHIPEDNYLHANAQMRVGGLLVDEDGASLDCIRRRGRKATLRDRDDDQPLDESRLEAMLGGISRETFLTRFGLSHEELVRGGAAILSGEGDLGQMLFAAGAGVGRLREIQDDLEQQLGRLFTPRGSKNAINAALRQLDQQRKELRQAQARPAEFSQLHDRVEAKRRHAEQLEQQLRFSAPELETLRRYAQALPLIPQWRANIQSLREMAKTPLLDEAFTERRRQAVSDLEVARSSRSELEKRLRELSTRLEGSPIDAIVMDHESEIQAAFQEVTAREKADHDRLGLVRTKGNVDRKIVDLLHELSVNLEDQRQAQSQSDQAEVIDRSIDNLRVSDAVRTRIRKLAASHERLLTTRNTASDTVETIKRRLADTADELDNLGDVADPSVLSSAMESIGNPQAMLERLADERAARDDLRHRCESLLQRLDGFSGSLDHAAQLRPPSDASIQRSAAALQEAGEAVRSSKQCVVQRQAEHNETARNIELLQAGVSLPTAQELSEARRNRDQAADHLAGLTRSDHSKAGFAAEVDQAIERLRQGIHCADQLADDRQAYSQQVHKRDELAARLTTLSDSITAAKSAANEAQQRLEVAQTDWLAIWKECDVAADSPAAMQRWLSNHQQLCQLIQRLGDEQRRLGQTTGRIDRASARLRSALATATSRKPIRVSTSTQGELFDEPSEEHLLTLYDDAVAVRSGWEQKRRQHDSLSRRRDELAEELPLAETQFEAAQQELEAWREDWRRATESFVQSDRAGPAEVLQMLEQISELVNKKRESDILATRIRSIGEDDTSYAARLTRLAAAVGHATSDSDSDDQAPLPTAIAQSLYQRLQSERTASRSRQSLREQMESCQQRMAEIESQQSASQAVLKQLCDEAGCDQPQDLPEIERRSRERVTFHASLRDLENQLSILAGEQPLDEFIEAAGQQQPAVLEIDCQRKEAELANLRESLDGVHREIGALQHEISLMDGSGRAAELLQSVQLTVGQISRDAEQYARTKTALLMLRRAIDHYQKANQSPILALAGNFFSQLTCGQYSELKPDYDAKGKSTLFGVRADGSGTVPAGSMSSGTADSLYLALRLASLQHHASAGASVPLIIDDCLVQLDDKRAAAALAAFSQLSKSTQVILFTHHEHLLSLAQQHLAQGDYHSHQLGV